MKIELNIRFEKEVMLKKEIYELDMQNEDLAFKLFHQQLLYTKTKNKGLSCSQIEAEIRVLKHQIEENYNQKSSLARQLGDLEVQREKALEEIQMQ